MSVREELLRLLNNERGVYHSGAALARALGVSRNAVWKAAESLKAVGVPLRSEPRQGYLLPRDADTLTKFSVEQALRGAAAGLSIQVEQEVSSTNTLLKERAAAGAPHGAVLIAGAQKSGRGRMGRAFFSPGGTGLYLSVLLRPTLLAEDALLLTAAAAVAAAEAAEELSGRSCAIKWVNDIFCNGKKVCGILTEAALDLESGGLEYAVVGAGFNLSPPPGGFPEDLLPVAGALFDGPTPPDGRARLAAGFLRRFLCSYQGLPDPAFLDGYRARSLLTGRRVALSSHPGEAFTVTGIDERCRLLVRDGQGRFRAVASGEASALPVD